jgi:hypothetical protein
MSTRYRTGKDGTTIWDGDRQIAVVTGDLSDSAKIVRALNKRDAPLKEFLEVTAPEAGPNELAQLRELRARLDVIFRDHIECAEDVQSCTIWQDLGEALK